MEEKRAVPLWVTIILVSLVILSAGFYGYILFTGTSENFGKITVSMILALLCDGFSLLYCITGYKKSSAVFFNLCLYAAVIRGVYNQAAMIIAGNTLGMKFFLTLIVLVVLSIIIFVKDLGKTKSMTLACIALVSQMIYSFLSMRKIGFLPIVYTLGSNVYYIMFLLMVYAKYKDKEARGTK